MTTLDQTEVLVVGAGPVGMFTALLLAQSGVKTRIIDQEFRTAEHSYSCALHPRSVKLLNAAGIADDALQFCHRISTVGFYEGNMRRAEARLCDLPSEFPFALIVEQSTLEKLLEQKLHDANVRVHWNHRLVDLEMKGRLGAATIQKLAMTGKGYGVADFSSGVEKTSQVQTQFVVAADGSNSITRQHLGIEFEAAGPPQQFAVFEVKTHDVCGHEAKVILDDNSSSVLWPLSEARCRWSFEIASGKAGEDFPQKSRDRLAVMEPPAPDDSLHRFRRYVEHRAPWFKTHVEEVVWSTEVQFEPRLARSFGREVVWLAGDAAHQTGPIGMQSMNIGFREASDLADLLIQILRKDASTNVLRGYDVGHRCEWRQLLDFKTGTPATESATEWVRERAARIVASLPASGADLTCLLKQMAIDF